MKIIIVAGVMLLLACQSTQPKGSEKCYEVVAPVAFEDQMKSSSRILLVDVRTLEEFQEGHIEGSVNWDFTNGDFASKIVQADTSARLFVYCKKGIRSASARNLAIKNGVCNIVELDGGYMAWSKVHAKP